ncbi:PAS domain S-box protein [candidate division WOR-3 bacterium]|nr:PAS domain S-box protein [candidate division WOR-3 bacterium]
MKKETGSKKRISALIFQDKDADAKRLKHSLDKLGLSVYVSKKRSALTRKTIELKPDIVLFFSYESSKKNRSTYEKYKENIWLKKTGLIFILKSERQISDLPDFLSPGDDFIISPYKISELKSRMQKCIKSKRRVRRSSIHKKTKTDNSTSETHYLNLIENNPAAIAIHTGGKIVYANKKAIELVGAKSRKEVMGMPVFDFVHPDYKSIVAQRIKLAQEKGMHSETIEEKFLTLDKRDIDVEVASFPVIYENQKSSLVVFWDITGLKVIQRKLKESEEKFKQLFENLPDGVFLVSLSGKKSGAVIDTNASAEKQTGFNREELLSKNVFKNPEVRIFDPQLDFDNENLTPENFRFLFSESKCRKDKSKYWAEILTSSFNRGEDLYAISVWRDITIQKKDEEKILMLSHAVEQSSSLIMITDADGIIEYINPKFTAVTGYSSEEVVGSKPHFLKSGETTEAEYKALWKTIKSGKTWKGEFKNKKKNGDFYWESAVITPVKNSWGKIIRFFAIKEDITAFRQLHQQLAQVQKLDSIGILAGEMAHDFRNIISVISNLAEIIIMKKETGEDFNQELDYVKQSCKKASDLTNRLLTFSRKQEFTPSVIDLNEAIVNFEEMASHLIGEDVKIELIISSESQLIKADPIQIEQILINLTLNAKDAITQKPNTSKIISIETENIFIDDDYASYHVGIYPGEYAVFSVTDSGVGMTDDILHRVFEPFFTTKEKGKGCGLGLSIVYGIVKQNRAGINFYSEPGKGTTVKIYWPAVSCDQLPELSEHREKNLIGGSETILIVEDNKELRKHSSEILRSLGYNVIEADNGESALKIIESAGHNIDIVFTDIVMPVIDGEELVKRISEIPPHMKFLFCSGYPNGHRVMKGNLLTEKNFIQKSYPDSLLAKKIRNILDSEDK